METREGIILSREPNFETGRLKDCSTFEDCPFDNPAKVQIEVNDKVIYILIVTGNGKIIRIIREKKIA